MRTKRSPRRPLAGLALATAAVAAIVVASASAGVIRGTPKSDTLRGTAAADKLYGNGGNDKLYGLAGNDYLNGGPGNDVLSGGPGADVLACGPGRDTAVADARDKIGADCETVQGVPKPALAVAGASLAEGNAGTQSLSFTVTLANRTPLRVSVAYATANGTATAGSDYTATSGTLVFAPGETSKTVAVPILGDTAYESDETFTPHALESRQRNARHSNGDGRDHERRRRHRRRRATTTGRSAAAATSTSTSPPTVTR